MPVCEYQNKNAKYSHSGISIGKYSQRGICLFVKIFVIWFFAPPENLCRGKTWFLERTSAAGIIEK